MKIYKTNLAFHSGTTITYFNMKTLTNLSTTHTKTLSKHIKKQLNADPLERKSKTKSAMGKRNYNRKKKTTKKACANEK